MDIRRSLESIDLPWLSSALQGMFSLPQVLIAESQILGILEEAASDELNLIVMNIELGLIFYKTKDHRITGQLNRTRLLKLLCVDRIGELNIPARAMVLDGLQRMKLSAHPESEMFIKNIITKTKLDDLSELKTLTDSKGDFHSLHKLIYVDIRNPAIRQEIIDFIAKQAAVQAAHNMIGSRRGKSRIEQFAWRKILSDVDDTLMCTAGSFPSGIDTRYPKHAIYPGVMAFYRELDIGNSGSDSWDDSRVGNLVFLSARPHVYKDVSESYSYEKFKTLQATRGLYTSPSLLAGNLDSGSQFMLGGNMEPLAQKKFQNFTEYIGLYPEYQCIFIGDNGQGDVRAAEMVLGDPSLKNNIERVYIHKVQPLHLTHAVKDETKTYHAPDTCYFESYVDASLDAYKHGLIRLTGLRRVMVEACRDFDNISKTAWESGRSRNATCDREEALRELSAAVQRGNVVLVEHEIDPVPLPRYERVFPRGTAVHTNYGGGIVDGFDSINGIYEVHVNMGHSDVYGTEPPHLAKAFLRSSKMEALVPPGGGKGSLLKIPSISYTTKMKGSTANRRRSSSRDVSRHPTSYGGGFVEGALAWTPYGQAVILAHRKVDGVVILRAIGFPAVFYMPANGIVQLTEPPLLK
jgi:phosphatidate phosphatase APP1